jgi:uncharacterized protein (TIGR02594 family)
MNRRKIVLHCAAAAGTALIGRQHWAYAQSTEPSIFEGERVPTLEELIEQKGVAAPTPEEVKKAKRILAKCPTKQNPVEIALFFQRLRQGDFDTDLGNDAVMYATEWPVRANPVIVSFFDATTLRKPNGDQTAWCAAFVNWCIVRGREDRPDAVSLLKPTRSAASSTFRSWGQPTSDPKAGDIVVFKHKQESWRGHVVFFLGRSGTSISDLGGNQMPSRARLPNCTYERLNTGEVSIKLLPLNGADLQFHSFRTDPSLHDLFLPTKPADLPGSQK